MSEATQTAGKWRNRIVKFDAAVDPATLEPNPMNWRMHPASQQAALREVLGGVGWVDTVMVNMTTGNVIDGHLRRDEAEKAGELVPVTFVDLTEEEEAVILATFDPITAMATKHSAVLDSLLAKIEADAASATEAILTRGGEAQRLLNVLLPQPGGGTDEAPEPPDEPSTQPGDLIYLGRHRLLCGDSANADDVKKLLDGQHVQLVNTDPPYNVNVQPRSNNAIAAGVSGSLPRVNKQGGKEFHNQGFDLARFPSKSKATGQLRAKDRALDNDFLSDEEFYSKLVSWFGSMAAALRPGGAFYIWGGYANWSNYCKALEECGLYFSQGIVWVKDHPVLGRKDFMNDCEFAWYGWKKGAGHRFDGPSNARNVWHVKKVTPQSMIHLTEKPVELAERAMMYSSNLDERVLDLFGGSGSTMIAAERLGRRALLMEIDPAYCDVIVHRWQTFTGKTSEGWRGNEDA